MRPDFLDRYSRLDSPVHRQPAAAKLAVAVGVTLALALTPPRLWANLAVAASGLLAVAALSRVPWGFLLRRVLLLEVFVLGVAVLALFQPGGFQLFLFLLAKCALCLLTMVLLANTTPFDELLRVLRRARLPALLVSTLALMYRYLFVLVDEGQRMKRARLSRTFGPRRSSAWRARATVVGQLFIRCTERAERIYGAMCARGWR